MRIPPRLLFACLFAPAALSAQDLSRSAAFPRSDNAIPDVTWAQVETTSGHLAFEKALTAFALTAPTEAFPEALDSIERWLPQARPASRAEWFHFRPDPDERKVNARSVLARAFTRRAPDEAVAYHARVSSPALVHFRPPFFSALTRIDPTRALAELQKIPAGEDRQKIAALVVSARSADDPLAALALREALGVLDVTAIANAFESVARIDPLKAIAALSSLPDDHLRRDACERIIGEWMIKSPNEALAWVMKDFPENGRPALLKLVLSRTGYRDFALLESIENGARDPVIQTAAARAIEGLLYTQPRQYAWDRVLKRGWEGISKDYPSNRISFTRSLYDLVQFASLQPPEQVRKLFQSLPAGYGEDRHHADDIMKAWTLADPEGALAWAEKLPVGAARDIAAARGQMMLAELDPDLAFQRLRALPADATRAQLVQTTFDALVKKDLRRAAAETPFLEEVADHLYGMGYIANAAFSADPDTMIAMVHEESISAGIRYAFALAWLSHEPDAALEWYQALPASSLKNSLQDMASHALAASNRERAIDFAISLPDGKERIALIAALAEKHSVTAPEAVLALIDTLPASGQRTSLHAKAIAQLAADDPARTAAQLDAGALGPVTRQTINAVIEKWAPDSAAESARWLTAHLKPAENHPDLVYRGVNQVARHYAQQQPAAAVAWADSLADDFASRRATVTALEEVARSSRPLALRLLATTSLPEKQKADLASRFRP